MRRRRQVFCCPPPAPLAASPCSSQIRARSRATAREWEERWTRCDGPSGRAGLRTFATVLRSVVHLLPIARRSPAATEHDVGGGRRRAAPTGGGSITRSGAFHGGPQRATKPTTLLDGIQRATTAHKGVVQPRPRGPAGWRGYVDLQTRVTEPSRAVLARAEYSVFVKPNPSPRNSSYDAVHTRKMGQCVSATGSRVFEASGWEPACSSSVVRQNPPQRARKCPQVASGLPRRLQYVALMQLPARQTRVSLLTMVLRVLPQQQPLNQLRRHRRWSPLGILVSRT